MHIDFLIKYFYKITAILALQEPNYNQCYLKKNYILLIFFYFINLNEYVPMRVFIGVA